MNRFVSGLAVRLLAVGTVALVFGFSDVAMPSAAAQRIHVQQVGASPTVAVAPRHVPHYDVYYLVNHRPVLWGSVPSQWQADQVVHNLRWRHGYVAWWVFHHR